MRRSDNLWPEALVVMVLALLWSLCEGIWRCWRWMVVPALLAGLLWWGLWETGWR